MREEFKDGKYWCSTDQLRWAYGRDDNDPVLQQLWLSVESVSEEDWRDIPSVRLPSLNEEAKRIGE